MKQSFHLIDIPGSKARSLFNLVRSFDGTCVENSCSSAFSSALSLSGGKKALLCHDVWPNETQRLQQYAPSSLGVVFIDPITRLAIAYQHHCDSVNKVQTFEQFARQPGRRNIIKKLLKDIAPEQLGFIGIAEHFSRSQMLLTDWLNESPQWDLHRQNVSRPADLSEEQKALVVSLNQDDSELYESVRAQFELRWRRFKERFALSLPADKRIIIHCGPPKTGTSALQAWLQRSRTQLRDQMNVFYPAHSLDKNNVSSGHFSLFFSSDNGNTVSLFDRKKAQALLDSFAKSASQTLILSSEYFFQHLPVMLTALPSAEVIFYTRNPVEKAESLYNQGVKRHGETRPFTYTREWRFYDLEKYLQVVSDFNATSHIRFHHKELLEGGSLIHDFCNSVSIRTIASDPDRQINRSLSAGALELMRLTNHFADEALSHDLEGCLQSHCQSREAYSLLTYRQREQADSALLNNLNMLQQTEPALPMEKLYYLVTEARPRKHIPQEEALKEMSKVVSMLKHQHPRLVRRLYLACMQAPNFSEKEYLFCLLKTGQGNWFQAIISKIRNSRIA